MDGVGGTWRIYLFSVALVALGIWYAARALDLAPPTEARIAAGAPGSGYRAVADAYAEILAEDGIALTVLSSNGSVDNARLLAEGRVDLALLQGGVPVASPDGPGAPAEAIAALFFEPVLAFERKGAAHSGFPPDWQGLDLAVGAPGSGTRFAFERMSGAMGLDPGANRLLPIGGAQAADALLTGEADIALFVAPLEAPYLSALVESGAVGPIAIEGAAAIARRLRELVVLDLPAGTLDYRAHLPAEDLAILATPARMVARDGLHPALVNRLVRAARRLHGPAGLLAEEGTFPSAARVGAPLNGHARALLQDGPPALEELLPYWVVAQINRFALLLLPVLFLLLPLLRALPGLYDWAVRRRIYRHYRSLREIDLEVDAADAAGLDRLDTDLSRVERSLRALKVPLPFRQSAYLAQAHLDLVRRRITARRARLSEGRVP